MEVPFWRSTFSQFRGDPAVERMGVSADDHTLLGNRKSNAVPDAQSLDRGVRTRFLLAEVIGWNADHDQAPVPISIPKLLQGSVLGREAAFGSSVYDEDGSARIKA